MTAAESYIESLKKLKEREASLDEAIIIAETLLVAVVKKENEQSYMAGGKAGFNAAQGKDVLTFEEYWENVGKITL